MLYSGSVKVKFPHFFVLFCLESNKMPKWLGNFTLNESHGWPFLFWEISNLSFTTLFKKQRMYLSSDSFPCDTYQAYAVKISNMRSRVRFVCFALLHAALYYWIWQSQSQRGHQIWVSVIPLSVIQIRDVHQQLFSLFHQSYNLALVFPFLYIPLALGFFESLYWTQKFLLPIWTHRKSYICSDLLLSTHRPTCS